MSAEFRAIKANELEECLDLWGNVFKVGRDYFPPYFYGDPWFKRAYTRVAVIDCKIVSAIQICERRVRIGKAEVVMGGIGNVATLPEYRGRGYSQRLLNDCARVMNERRIDFSVLFTGIQPFYEKALWRSVPQKYLHADVLSVKKHAHRYAIRTSDWDSDLPSLQAIYESFNKGRALTTIRTDPYWRGYVRARFSDPEYCLIAELGGKTVGYLAFGYNKPTCWPREIGYLPGHEACVSPLFEEMIAVCPTRGEAPYDSKVERLSIVLPHELAIMEAIEGVAKNIEAVEPMGGMFRITHMRSLSERLLPELDRRAKGCPDGAISLDTELGSLRFTVSKGHATHGAKNSVRVPMSQLEFFCLLFGIKDAAELSISLPDGAADIIATIFPRQRPVFWGPDHF